MVAEMARIPWPEAPADAEQHFAAVRSAASAAAGEEYFRTVYAGSLAWNVRDQHMARNVEEIAEHVGRQSGRPGKVAVWGHNTHAGDARATFAANRGELNLGQLMRQRHRDAAFLVGFFTYTGQVFAAPEWDMPGRVYDVRPALPGSYSDVFHQGGVPAFSSSCVATRIWPGASASLGWNGRSGSSTCRKASGRATISRRAFRTSSTRSSSSIARAR